MVIADVQLAGIDVDAGADSILGGDDSAVIRLMVTARDPATGKEVRYPATLNKDRSLALDGEAQPVSIGYLADNFMKGAMAADEFKAKYPNLDGKGLDAMRQQLVLEIARGDRNLVPAETRNRALGLDEAAPDKKPTRQEAISIYLSQRKNAVDRDGYPIPGADEQLRKLAKELGIEDFHTDFNTGGASGSFSDEANEIDGVKIEVREIN